MTLPSIDKMNRTEGSELYEAIVAAWKDITEENTSQKHLVTDAQWKTWQRAYADISRRIINAGDHFARTGEWVGLSQIRDTLNSATRTPGSELEAAAQASARADERRTFVERVSGWLR